VARVHQVAARRSGLHGVRVDGLALSPTCCNGAMLHGLVGKLVLGHRGSSVANGRTGVMGRPKHLRAATVQQ
jgi:hypothetical protein